MKKVPSKMGTWQGNVRDDDLALFHDMRRREHRNFLCPIKDDIDSSSSSTPTRTDRDLLPPDSEKNDYDWLLTPPSTPLFPSLDQDGPIVNLSQRRVLTRSTSMSRTTKLSYTQESAPKFTRGGYPSPKHPSTASSTSSTLSTGRGRPISPSWAHKTNSTARSSSPCRISTQTGRNTCAASKSNSRSLTPTLRRDSFSPSPAIKVASCGRSRPKSLSPNLQQWEPSLAGFASEPPPNLRTSLSERTVKRGLSQSSRKGMRIRSSSEEMIDMNVSSRWFMNSTDESGNWSLSYSNDFNSSQTSKGSVVSSYEDDLEMIESATSVDRSLNCGPKSANVKVKAERSVLPAKRQMQPAAGNTGDVASSLYPGARKSNERQSVIAAQRRNPHIMFRPMLTSAPITTFYCNRPVGMHAQSSSLFMTSSTLQMSSLPHKQESNVHILTDVSLGNPLLEQAVCQDSLSGRQETIEEGNEVISLSDEESLTCHTDPLMKGNDEKTLAALKGHDGSEKDGFNVSNIKQKIHEDPIDSKKSLHTVKICVSRQFKEGALDDKRVLPGGEGYEQHDVTSCAMELDLPEQRIHAGSNSDCNASFSELLAISNVREQSSEEIKEKNNNSEGQNATNTAKPQAAYLGTSNLCSPHGSQRILSDLGSFRNRSALKGLYSHSHDGSLISEKNSSCDLSDCHSFMRILNPAISDAGDNHHECSGGLIGEVFYPESNDVADKAALLEEITDNLEDLNKHAFSTVRAVMVEYDYSECETSATCSSTASSSVPDQPETISLVCVPIEISSEASTSEFPPDNSGSTMMHKMVKEDILSIIDVSTSRTTMLDADSVKSPCTDAACDGQPLHTNPRPAGEITIQGDMSARQLRGIRSLKRSLTLEEATDTILFCNSIVHELVYKAASLAIEKEQQKVSRSLISKRDFVALFGFSGADSRNNGLKIDKQTREHRHQPLGNETICETSSLVQKQRMVHRHTPAVTMRQSPMERIENAFMGNHEEIQAPERLLVAKGKIKQGKKIQCRCSCCMM
ncbi:hypothetical protein KP509_01G121900 [Ceratopteris richardii]|uniref:Uncharacterized protein n=1 Tax=Ceratopteris richardii TaxID=49495 RepID=A0A8T2VL38_CERRI|nr:hypothetical protein KP509_01G121900 [Ceratopteris richardii]